MSPVVNVKVGANNAWMTIHGKSRVRAASPWSKWDDYDTTTHPDGLMRLQRRSKGRRALSPWSKWDDYDTTTHPDGLMRLQRRNQRRRALSPWSKWDDYDTTTHPDGLMRLQRRRQYSPPCLVGPCKKK